MSDKETKDQQELMKLAISEGPDVGKSFKLEADREYLVGRSEECDIRIDQADKTVSRRHALLKTGSGTIVLENLSSTNPVMVAGKAVPVSATIKPGGRFQVGATVFTLEKGSGTGTRSLSSSSRKKLALVALPLLLFLIVIMMVFGGGDREVQEISMTRPGEGLPAGTAALEAPRTLPDLPEIGEISVSSEDRQRANEHFRQGMFFFDTGNLLRAVNEWERALGLNPNHSEARSWFFRAEKELEDRVRQHYQRGMTHYNLMRYDQAVQEFRMVLQLSRDKTTEQYMNALRYVDEIRGR